MPSPIVQHLKVCIPGCEHRSQPACHAFRVSWLQSEQQHSGAGPHHPLHFLPPLCTRCPALPPQLKLCANCQDQWAPAKVFLSMRAGGRVTHNPTTCPTSDMPKFLPPSSGTSWQAIPQSLQISLATFIIKRRALTNASRQAADLYTRRCFLHGRAVEVRPKHRTSRQRTSEDGRAMSRRVTLERNRRNPVRRNQLCSVGCMAP